MPQSTRNRRQAQQPSETKLAVKVFLQDFVITSFIFSLVVVVGTYFYVSQTHLFGAPAGTSSVAAMAITAAVLVVIRRILESIRRILQRREVQDNIAYVVDTWVFYIEPHVIEKVLYIIFGPIEIIFGIIRNFVSSARNFVGSVYNYSTIILFLPPPHRRIITDGHVLASIIFESENLSSKEKWMLPRILARLEAQIDEQINYFEIQNKMNLKWDKMIEYTQAFLVFLLLLVLGLLYEYPTLSELTLASLRLMTVTIILEIFQHYKAFRDRAIVWHSIAEHLKRIKQQFLFMIKERCQDIDVEQALELLKLFEKDILEEMLIGRTIVPTEDARKKVDLIMEQHKGYIEEAIESLRQHGTR